MAFDTSTVFWASRTDEEDAREKAADLAGSTPDERGELLVALCRLASEQIAQHPDPARTLRWQDPLSDETEALLLELHRKHA